MTWAMTNRRWLLWLGVVVALIGLVLLIVPKLVPQLSQYGMAILVVGLVVAVAAWFLGWLNRT